MRRDYQQIDPQKTILVTGAAGFIGFHLAKELLESGCTVIGYDNLNDYYEVSLKKVRLAILEEYDRYHFIRGDLVNREKLAEVFQEYAPRIVVNLAAHSRLRC